MPRSGDRRVAVAGTPWALGAEAALEATGSSRAGLASPEAQRRLERHGRNEIETARGPGALAILLHQFRSPLISILLAAAAVTVLLEEFLDAAVIAAVLLINAVLGLTQEYRAERSLEALRRLGRSTARVLRGGAEREIDAAELVPGDVVLVHAGDRVPADLRLLHAVALETDESLLTGESTTVTKSIAAVPADAGIADRFGMAFMGTVVTRGHAQAVVVATGAETELGRIAGSLRQIRDVATPLQRRMSRFARVVGAIVIAVAGVGLGLGVAVGDDPGDLFLAIVALAVSAIPEGLPIVLTLVLAIGVRRMAARNAIVRRLPAVETLGSCTVIGSDKTGTLTENRMTVQRILAGGRWFDVTGAGYAAEGHVTAAGRVETPADGSPLALTLLAGLLCNEASAVRRDAEFDVLGDPTEIALLVAAAKAGLDKDVADERYERVGAIPFDSERRYAASYNRVDEATHVFVKGAPEEVLELCTSAAGGAALDPGAVLGAAETLADEGLRVLAFARGEVEAPPEPAAGAPDELEFLGLQAMIDPPREEAAAAVAACRSAGVRVLMITGDHAATAAAVARSIGIAGAERGAVTGKELDAASDEQLRRLVGERSVFARVSPQHKLRIVEALRARGETVAVTGDGVNDAPALKAADIGAAMGTGTDVAKEAADMVVTDDDFATIVAAVEEGRVAFDNVRKTTFFLISSGAAEIAAVLASIAFRLQLPFVPAQLLWLNLVTNGVQDVALAFEPGERDVLERPPRPRNEGVVSRVLWERTVVAGVVMAVGTLALFLHELHATDDLERARTVALTTMVLFQVFHVGNSRSEHASAFRKSLLSNRFLFVGTAAALALHAAALYLPPTQYVLRVQPLDSRMWLEMAVVASSVIVAVELHKLVRRPPAAATAG